MQYRLGLFLQALIGALIGVSGGCSSRSSPSSFHLPAGDVERGKAVFVNLNCHSCHEVPGTDLPKPYVQPVVPVRLGGVIDRRLSDAYLVTSLLDPDHQLAPYPRDQITSAGKSRMPCYAGKMTTQQMIDVVAFLQSRYVLRRWSPQYF